MGSTKASKKVSKKKVTKKSVANTTKHNKRTKTYATRDEGRAAITSGEYNGY